MYEGPGIYRHYKGRDYEVLGLALPESSVELGKVRSDAVQIVVYRPLGDGSLLELEDPPASFWLRPRPEFDEMVDPSGAGEMVPRFSFLDQVSMWGDLGPAVDAGTQALFGHHPERGGQEREQAVFAVLTAARDLIPRS